MNTIGNTEEDKNTLIQLQCAIARAGRQFDADPAKSGIQINDNGSYSIIIDRGPTFWFNNENELAEWVINTNRT